MFEAVNDNVTTPSPYQAGPVKAEHGATVGATFGTNVYGQINSGNISTYIAGAAIQTAQIGSAAVGLAQINTATIGSLSAFTATIGTLRTASSGARTEISDNRIRVYDSSNTLRVKIGDLS
jgi:hypothetical protein